MKETWLILSLSAVLLCSSNCKSPGKLPAAKDCNDKSFQDSLIHRFIDMGAEKIPYIYNNPAWASYFDSLLAICPRIAVAYQLKAIPAIKNGEYEKAFELNNKAAEIDPREFLAYRGFLKCIFTKDYEGAIPDFQKANQISPGGFEMDHSYFFYMGLCYLELGQYAEAGKNLEQDFILQNEGDTAKTVHFNSLLYMGIVKFENNEPAAAKKYLIKCLKIYKELPEANYYLALIYKKEDNVNLEKKYLEIAKESILQRFSMNEDNLYYVYYPHQITLYEIEKQLTALKVNK